MTNGAPPGGSSPFQVPQLLEMPRGADAPQPELRESPRPRTVETSISPAKGNKPVLSPLTSPPNSSDAAATPNRTPGSSRLGVRSLYSPTVASVNRAVRPENLQSVSTMSLGSQGRRSPAFTPGRGTQLSPRSPRSSLAASRSLGPRSPWVNHSTHLDEKTVEVFNSLDSLERERRERYSRTSISPRQGSPKSWAEQLGGGRHDPYLAAAPPTWASSQVERRQTDSQLHNVPKLSPRASKGTIASAAWDPAVRPVAEVFNEFLDERRAGKTIARGMSPRRANEDWKSGLRPDTSPPAQHRPAWVGVSPTSVYQASTFSTKPPKTNVGVDTSPRPHWHLDSATSGAESAFPPQSVLIKQRLKSAAPASGFPSPRQTDKHWMSKLCDDKKELDSEDRELMYTVPIPPADYKDE